MSRSTHAGGSEQSTHVTGHCGPRIAPQSDFERPLEDSDVEERRSGVLSLHALKVCTCGPALGYELTIRIRTKAGIPPACRSRADIQDRHAPVPLRKYAMYPAFVCSPRDNFFRSQASIRPHTTQHKFAVRKRHVFIRDCRAQEAHPRPSTSHWRPGGFVYFLL